MEILIAIAAKIADYTVRPIGQWLCYSFQYSSNIGSMQNQVEKLRLARERVQHSIDAARNNGEQIEGDVNKWLEAVDKNTEKAMKVLESEEEARTKGSIGACLKLVLQHQLSRKAKKIVQDIEVLEQHSIFENVSYRPATQDIVTTRNMNYVDLESRMSTVKMLMEALRDDNIHMIGVWGMPGVGKTTLVREVAKQAKGEKLFDEVAIANVTHSPDLRRIQGEIADVLDLKFDKETVRGRASILLERLSQERKKPVILDDIFENLDFKDRLTKTKDKKILVILDDIWENFDLEEIGIPYEGCKVLLTSRNRDVLFSKMGTQKNFGLEVLDEKEAWSLFEKMAGDCVQDPNLQCIATNVAKECAGMPLALVTVSKALKNKEIFEWNDALQLLRRPTPEHLMSKIYSSIELSYQHLKSKEVQYVFLLCSQLGYYISKMDLLKYCYGLGLFPGINTMEEARNRVSTIVRILKDCGLLLHSPYSSESLRMHDVVRYVAILIASRDHNMFVVGDAGGLQEWPDVDALKRCGAFTILDGNIQELPNEMECPGLRFLCLWSRDRPMQISISDTFFEGMRNLKVLDLTQMQLSSLPSSLRLLRNLQTLCMYDCVLGDDIAIIGELKNLTILNLNQSHISQLPREIRLLTRLRLLDLSNCSKLEVIPPNVLSSLVALEELYMRNSFVQWEAEGLNNASLAELKHLSHLITLEIHIRDANNLPKDLSFEKLKRYLILVGDVWDWPAMRGEASKTLKLKLNTSFQSEVGIKMLLRRTENLYIDKLKGVKSVLNELDKEGFQQLKHLRIQNNAEIKCIISSRTLHIAFPALETILLKNMISLEEIICHGRLQKAFGNLRVVKVEQCDKLKFVFPSSIAKGLSQLEELEIRECSIIGAIVMKEEGEIEDTDVALFPQLRHLALEHLPKLMSFLSTQNSLSTDDAGEIILEAKPDFYMPILHEQVVFPHLERLQLSSIGLEDIHQATWSSCRLDMQSTSRFQNLLELEVKGCGNIKYLLSFSTAKFMVHLKSLEILECKAMEEILLTEDLGVVEEIIPKVLFPRLEALVLKELPILERFCRGSNIKFPSLKVLVLDHCPKLKTFVFKPVSSCMTTSKELKEMNTEESPHTAVQPLFNEEVAFPCLEELVIWHMDDLKILWQNQFPGSLEVLIVHECRSLLELYELQGLNVTEAHAVTAIQLKMLYLYRLPKMKHVWNKDPQEIFSFQNLRIVHTVECKSLKSLFPASVARCLTQLEDLRIVDCGVLEEIVAGEEGAEAITRFVFPQVSNLRLDRLPRLKCFYPGRHASEWPMLKDLYVGGCHEVDIFASQLLSETLEESQLEISVKQPIFFVDEVAFPSLEHLTISHMKNLKIIWRNQFGVDSFYKLQGLRVDFCENLVNIFQSDMLTRFQSLETLHVRGCDSLQAVFELEGLNVTETHDVTAIQLKGLYLVNLPNMRHVWSKDPKPIFSFQNLGTVFLLRCWSLKSLFPASVATCLTQLERLVIACCGAEEIVAGEEAEKPILEEIVAGEEAEQPIARFVFPQVTVIHLVGLPRLKWFYRGVHTTEWPMLKDMLAAGCPEVEIFASELSSFQDILRLEISIKQPLFLVDEVPFPSLEKLRISYMPDLKIIWHNQFTADSFCKPQIIKVEFCENLIDQETCAVPETQLKELHLIHLPKLNHIWNKEPQQIFSFAMGCESMESLFPEIQDVEIDNDWGVEKIVLRNQNSSESYLSRMNTSE